MGLYGEETDLFGNLMHLKPVTEEKDLSQRWCKKSNNKKEIQNSVKDVTYISGATGKVWLAGSSGPLSLSKRKISSLTWTG